jgi:two-component system, response regulator PdtaR
MIAAAPMLSPELWLAAAPSDGEGRPREDRNGAVVAGSRLKVLIVEDEFFIALDNQAQVEDLGHTVVGIAASADQAVGMAGREKPDIVLMDIRLTGSLDGIDAAAEIRDRFDIASIFVTANTDPATLQRAQRTRPLGILHKPLERGRLRDMLARVATRNQH